MPRETCYDVPGGDTITYDILTDDGFRLPKFNFETGDAAQSHFDDIPDMSIRDDDVIICSYPKTGTNWLYEMVTMATKNTSVVTGGSKILTMLEAIPLAVPDKLPSPRLLNSHLPVKYLPKGVKGKKIKTVLLCRNPKDVAVSFYNHTKGLRLYDYEGKFENYQEMFKSGEVDYGSYAEYLVEFQQVIKDTPDWPVHIVYYEDLKESCFDEMKKVLQFAKVDITDEMLQKVVESCSMKNIREGKQNALDEKAKEFRKKMAKNDFSLYRKGQIGDWKNWFTVAQSEAFDSWWKRETEGLNMFTFRYVAE